MKSICAMKEMFSVHQVLSSTFLIQHHTHTHTFTSQSAQMSRFSEDNGWRKDSSEGNKTTKKCVSISKKCARKEQKQFIFLSEPSCSQRCFIQSCSQNDNVHFFCLLLACVSVYVQAYSSGQRFLFHHRYFYLSLLLSVG